MKHKGKAKKAGTKLILGTLVLLLLLIAAGAVATLLGTIVAALTSFLVIVWLLFAVFSINFFRDPDPSVPSDSRAIVAPAHGKVDWIDETTEESFMGGRCKRVSIFLSVFDVHIQNSPIEGQIAYLKHSPGKFMNAMKTDCSAHNENVLVGLESKERAGERIGVRLIAGLLARRIIPWAAVGDEVNRGERISLIQFGSRVDIFLPLTVDIRVKLGERVKGGESVIALRT